MFHLKQSLLILKIDMASIIFTYLINYVYIKYLNTIYSLKLRHFNSYFILNSQFASFISISEQLAP